MSFSVITTTLAPAASYDLTDLATVKDELALSANNTSLDSWLGRAISQVSQAIAASTRRVFVPELVRDSFDIEQDPYPYQTPGGFPALQLSRWPVLGVLSVTQTIGIATTQPLTVDVDYRVDPATGQLLRLNPFTGVATIWEACPVTVTYVAGYGASVVEAHTVPSAAPYQISVAQLGIFSCDQLVADLSGTPLQRVAGAPGAGQYSVAAGIYSFSAEDAGRAIVTTYAVRAVPADLVGIALRLINGRYRSKDRDPSLIQRETPGVGMERWWFGGAPGQKGQFPPDIDAALEFYRVPVVA